jgi:hypothetical protein
MEKEFVSRWESLRNWFKISMKSIYQLQPGAPAPCPPTASNGTALSSDGATPSNQSNQFNKSTVLSFVSRPLSVVNNQ